MPTDAADDAAADAAVADAFVPADHAPLPAMPLAPGGAVLPHLQLVTITFAGYPFRDHVEQFGDDVGSLAWFSAVGAEYGVQTLTSLQHVSLAETPPTRVLEADVTALLAAHIADGSLPPPAADGSVVYGVYYPIGTTVLNAGYTACRSFNGDGYGGYHDESRYDGTRFAFFVAATCGTDPTTTADGLTTTASHELIEIATDPFPTTALAYDFTDPSVPWTYLPGETGDVCYHLWTRERGYLLQRIWSNLSATAGLGSPCVPVTPGEPYYNTTSIPADVQRAHPGDTVSFTVQGWSSAPVDDWNLTVLPYGNFRPTIHVDATQMNNGRTATVTLTVPAGATSGQVGIGLVNNARSADDFNQLPLVVYVP